MRGILDDEQEKGERVDEEGDGICAACFKQRAFMSMCAHASMYKKFL